MIYFLLRAGSYRAARGPSDAALHVCALHTPTHTSVHTPSMKQHMCIDCFKSLCHGGVRGGQQAEPPQASPDKPRVIHPNVTPPADHTGRASPVSCLQTLFSAGWRAAGLCQIPAGSSKRGSSGQWVWHTQHHHLIPKTTFPTCPSSGTTSLWQGPQSLKHPCTLAQLQHMASEGFTLEHRGRDGYLGVQLCKQPL